MARLDLLHDVVGNLEELPLVRQRGEGAFGAVVHAQLQRLDQGRAPARRALDGHVTQHEERRL